jgi:hypothetical protein
MACDADRHRELLPVILPVYTSLAAVLVHKAEFPPDNMAISSEDREAFRCYRQDIADTMVNTAPSWLVRVCKTISA